MTTRQNTDQIADRPAEKPINRRSRLLWLAGSVLVLVAVSFYLIETEDTIDVEKETAVTPEPLVSVETIPLAVAQAEIRAFAEIRPRWSAELRAAVSGRVLSVEDQALSGSRVSRDTTLITFENIEFLAQRTEARLSLKQARLELRLAESATEIARRQFKRDGIKAPNDLALHLPELAIAESAVETAKARLAVAGKELADTTVKAPFSGFVTERYVSPGQSVSIGEPLLKLVDDSAFELTMEVNRKDWQLLKQPLEGIRARILDQDGAQIAEAVTRSAGGFLDAQTRQYKVFLEINDTDSSVLSGEFVQVVMPGTTIGQSLNIPASSLTRDGFVWMVDNKNRLQKFIPDIVFRRGDRIIIRPPDDAESWKIAVTPLLAFLPGQHVQPQTAE